MSTLVLPTNPAVGTTAALRPRLPVGLLALGGGLLAVAGAAAPWLSFFAGLQPISGLAGTSGQLAAALGGVSALIGIVFLLSGRPALRWMLALAGFALLVLAGWSGLNLLTTLPALQADPLLVVEPGPGLPVLAVGGILVLVTLFLPAHGSTRLAVVVPEPAVRSTVTWTLALAGIVHLAMGPGHLPSALVAGAMIAGGLAQLGLALLVARNRTARWPLVLAVVLQASFVLAYLAAVTVGLPVDAAPHADEIAAAGHGALGHTETVTPLGVLTLGLELVGAAAGVGLIAPRRSTSRRAPGVDGTATRGL